MRKVKAAEKKDVFLNVRFDRGLHSRLVELARRNDRTLAGEIRAATRAHLERELDAS